MTAMRDFLSVHDYALWVLITVIRPSEITQGAMNDPR